MIMLEPPKKQDRFYTVVFVFIVICMIGSLAMISAGIYAAIHFISKYW